MATYETKIDHLIHYEDTFICPHPCLPASALRLMGIPNELIINEKIDGAPSVFLGKGYDGSPIFATKSLMNKTPKYAINFHEIEEIYNEPLKFKMMRVADAFMSSGVFDSLYPGEILQGDVVRWSSDDPGPANLLKYETPLTKSETVVYIHSIYTYDKLFGVSGLKLSAERQNQRFEELGKIDNAFIFACDLIPFITPEQLNAYRIILGSWWHLYTSTSHKLTVDHYNKFSLIINSIIKNGNNLSLITPDMFYGAVKKLSSDQNVDVMMHVDPMIIRTYSVFAGHRMFLCALFEQAADLAFERRRSDILGYRSQYGNSEGFVVKQTSTNRVLKIINRETFSYHNFKKWEKP